MTFWKAAFGLLVSVLFVVVAAGPANAEFYYDKSTHSWQPVQNSVQTGRRAQSTIARQEVDYKTSYPAGTIVVETGQRRLYFVLGGGKAEKYGIGVGRVGFQWSGVHHISRKAKWPGWTPPAEMRQRVPGLPTYMPGGINNPLGARALYIGSTLYRIHGTSEPWTIGHAVSSGCIRLTNADIIDLYNRARIGALVVVHH